MPAGGRLDGTYGVRLGCMILRGGVDIIVAVYRLLSLVDGLWVLHGWLWLGAALSELSY